MDEQKKINMDYDETFGEIRNRSVDDFLENKLNTVWMQKGYSKSSVKEYTNRLLRELEYQKDSFDDRLREVLEEKEILQNEKNLLAQQLKESVESLKQVQNGNTTLMMSELESEYTLKIEALASEKLDIQRENNQLTNQIIEFKNIISQYEEELNSFENGVNNNESKEVIENLKNENQKLLNEIEELKTNTLSEDKEYQEKFIVIQRENVDLKKELHTLEEHLKLSQEEFTTKSKLIFENKELKNDIARLEKELQDQDALKNHNRMLNEEIIELSKMTKKLSEEDKESKIKVISLEGKLETLINKHQYALEKMQNHIELEVSRRDEITKDKRDLQTKLLYAMEYVNELYDKFDYMNTLNKMLHNQLDAQRQKNRKVAGLDMPPLSLEAIKSIGVDDVETEYIEENS